MSPLQFVSPSAMAPTMNILLYGPSGTGKTVGATSAPGPVLVLNAEGPGALRKAREIHGADKVREVAVTGKGVLDEAYLYLREGKGGEKTVVLDTVGETYRILLEEIGGDRPTLQNWGDVNTLLERFVRALRDLPLNVVLVCHEEVVVDGTTGETMRQPVTGGKKLPGLLMAQVDVVAYTGLVTHDDGRVDYEAQLVTAGGRHGKDRSGRLGVHRTVDLTEWIATATKPDAPPKAAERKAA
jgi:hypothetical protein